MKANIKTISKRIDQNKKERAGFSDRTFLIVAENKKGKAVPLIVELRNENDIDILVFNKKGYKVIDNVKLNALIGNPIIKAVHGSCPAAINFKSLIKDKLTEEERMDIISNINNVKESDAVSAIESLLMKKMEQTTQKKYDILSKQSVSDIDNRFMIVYEYEGRRIYLNAIQQEENIVLENPLLKEVGKIKMSIKDLVESEKVIGIYGTSSLAEKIKELHSVVRLQVVSLSLIDKEELIVKDIKENKDNNVYVEDKDVTRLLKDKKPKSSLKIKK